tara:strand:+ start:10085 stop:11929 length:1845 start_codon:yes stop_codon:yes gene_type:complete
MIAISLFILFLPLLGSAVSYAFRRSFRVQVAQVATTSFVGISCLLSFVLAYTVYTQKVPVQFVLAPWVLLSGFSINWSFSIDILTAVMFVVVTFVSFCVHLYSTNYMKFDKSIVRFMSYLSLFTFMMLLLVSSANLLQLFVGWEGVGLCSYLLIGFWFEKNGPCQASYKAFIVNRIGDFFFILGIAVAYVSFGSLDFSEIFAHKADVQDHAAMWVCGLFFIGAMAKSAQIGLHVWLPDAMEGPTPVSALIHAATMVTAGIFLLVRFSPVLNGLETLNTIILYVGALTAFYAGTVALAQNDLKRIIAFSTCSQLGYMMMAIGATAYSAALFHLVTHAFFKALLFLSAGSVISLAKGEHDVRKMPEFGFKAPVTYIMMLIGSLALIGAPFLSGYYSKDLILETVMQSKVGMIPYIIGVISVALTAIYSVRLFVYVFHSKARGGDSVEINESPFMMLVPLGLLAIPSLGIGYFLSPYFTEAAEGIVHTIILPEWQKWLPTGIACSCFLVFFYIFYRQKASLGQLVKLAGPVHKFLASKWYFDELYSWIIVKPFQFIAEKVAPLFETKVIDRYGPNGVARLISVLFQMVSKIQTGAMYHYMFYMLCGVTAIIGIYLLR